MAGKWDLVKEKLTLVEGWARDGLIERQIAKNLGVAMSTFCKYKAEHMELSEALKKGKEVVDFEVENALLKRALGYEYRERREEETLEGTKITTFVKHMPPDTTAIIFWLKNRKPEQWRDKRDVEVSDDSERVVNVNITRV